MGIILFWWLLYWHNTILYAFKALFNVPECGMHAISYMIVLLKFSESNSCKGNSARMLVCISVVLLFDECTTIKWDPC